MGIGNRIEEHSFKKQQENVGVGTKGRKDNTPINFVSERPKYGLNEMILSHKVREEILDVADYAHNSKIVFETWGLGKTHAYSKRMGINLYGPPGTGKTMAAHAIAQHLNRKILPVNYADIESKYVGETPKNIRRAFTAAKEENSILFFDEADAILSRRVTNMNNATDVSVNQTRSVMLMLLNEYEDFVIFATNFIENLDPAFMRRIAKHVKFELPDEECRCALWRRYIPAEMPNNIDCDALAKKYTGVSGSDIANAILLAAFKAVRNQAGLVTQGSVEKVMEGILHSKKDNEARQGVTTKRVVSEEYAKKQMQKQEVSIV